MNTHQTTQTAFREGERIRATNGMGYSDRCSDDWIRVHIAASEDTEHNAFAQAVLAIRAYERVAT